MLVQPCSICGDDRRTDNDGNPLCVNRQFWDKCDRNPNRVEVEPSLIAEAIAPVEIPDSPTEPLIEPPKIHKSRKR
jgi:hypothetical protein